jgi:exopolysaccharide biosynthesis polyprenyl glycosylphosphotransferase
MSEHPARAAASTERPASGAWVRLYAAEQAGELPAPDGSLSLPSNQGALPGQGRWYPILKAVLDLTIALLLLILIAPVMLVIALLVKLESPGPIFFRQVRVGLHGRPFAMLKFRTMVRERRRCPGAPPPGVGERRRAHKTRGDPRVTRFGRILRRTSLDELPQLINVLWREMSLVGPRPEMPEIVARYEPWQHQRHQVRPGITGWWQVNRDGTRLMHEDVEMDIYYVENQSLRLDLLILARTARVVISGRGAY